jgi:recombinational DNA repair ATPase RecF
VVRPRRQPIRRHVRRNRRARAGRDALRHRHRAGGPRNARRRRGHRPRAGPHRDDLTLTLDGRELRAFGSAGQQRTAAIALRLLEGETLRERLGATPLLLLDDPFAELDVRRSARILELLAEQGLGQTLLTVPRASDIPPALTQLARWSISEGVVRTDSVAAVA